MPSNNLLLADPRPGSPSAFPALRGASNKVLLGRRLGELARHSAVYGFGSLVSRFIAVLLLPVYTRYLSPADYGLIETLIALSAVSPCSSRPA